MPPAASAAEVVMETKPDEIQEVQVPSEHIAVVAMFADRETAETAVDALLERGFSDDQISIVARGAGTDENGKFVPGGLMVTVNAKNREDEVERVLREHEAREVTTNRIGATGKVGEET
jgi:hypothetical protein